MVIYGTKLYFKCDDDYHLGICPNCGRESELRSFTAQRWYHIYFIPVIPGAKLRVLDQCPMCGLGHEMYLDDWVDLRSSRLESLLDDIHAEEISPDEVVEALHVLRWAGDRRRFAPAAARILQRFPDHVEILAALASSFAYYGMAEESRRTVSRLLELSPETDDDSIDRTETLHTEAPELSASTFPSVPWKLVSVAAIVSAVVLGAAIFNSRPDRVYVVNGTDHAYSAIVDGEMVRLSPWSHQRVDVEYGDVVVEPDSTDTEAFQPFTVAVKSSLFNRLRRQPVFVINPDRDALLVWEEHVYLDEEMQSYVTDKDLEDEELRIQYRFGKPFYRVARVDAAFEFLPEVVYEGRANERVYKTQLTALTDFAPSKIVAALYTAGQIEDARDYARGAIERHPDDDALLRMGTSIMDATEAVELLEPGLDARPVRVDWHRYYQENLNYLEAEESIIARYQRMLEEEPDNADLMYLLGRTIPDPDEAMELFRAASQREPPSAYAFHAMGHYYLNRGRFDVGLANARKARNLIPEHAQFLSTEEDLLLATGRVDELIDRALSRYSADGSFSSVTRLLFLLGVKGDVKASRNLVLNLRDELGPEEIPSESVAILQAAFEEGASNLDAFATESAKVDGPDYRFRAAVARADLSQAIALMDERGWSSYLNCLLLFVMSTRTGDALTADSLLERALSNLKDMSPRERRIAAWFAEGAEAPSLKSFYRESAWPMESVTLLLALGNRFPARRMTYLSAARTLNYDPTFPGLALSDLIRASE